MNHFTSKLVVIRVLLLVQGRDEDDDQGVSAVDKVDGNHDVGRSVTVRMIVVMRAWWRGEFLSPRFDGVAENGREFDS